MAASILAGGLKSVLGVVIVFLLLVTIHEFGHFIVAKKAGVLVPRFAIGFGPPLFRFGKGETEYSIRLFPLGGYVQLAGEIPQDSFFKLGERIAVVLDGAGKVKLIGAVEDLPDGVTGILTRIDTVKSFRLWLETDAGYRQFDLADPCYLQNGRDRIRLAPPDRQMNRKPLWARMAIVLAGPAMNVLLTIVLFTVVAGFVGVLPARPDIASVEQGSPAAAAGLRPGDVITAVDGTPMTNWYQLVGEIEQHPKQPLDLSVDRAGRTLELPIVPEARRIGGQTVGFIGITAKAVHDPVMAAVGGWQQTVQYTQLIYGALGQLVHHKSAFVKDLAGPVKIVTVIGQQAQLGVLNLVNLTAILSLNLAIFNLLPIPALDGSRFLFMVVELIRGRPIDPRKEYWVHAIGFAVIILFTVFRTYLDVTQLF